MLIGVSSDAGGGTKHLFSLISYLLSQDFKVSLILPNNGPLFEDFERLEINLFFVDFVVYVVLLLVCVSLGHVVHILISGF